MMRWFRGWRGLLSSGVEVEVLSLDEILQTLDADGRLDALPFMPEMVQYCGKRIKVFKRADKVLDLVRMTGQRRLKNTVILENVRCNGDRHGGCQAGCQILWKEAWIRRVPKGTVHDPRRVFSFSHQEKSRCSEATLVRVTRKAGEAEKNDFYSCQATTLFDASSSLVWWDPAQYLRPLFSGNITFWDFARGVLVSLFNFAQRLRGGCEYPYLVSNNLEKTPTIELDLQPGELVRVKSREEIQKTLRRYRNRGLWFDIEMLRYCGGHFKVLRRVDRVISERTGELLRLQNPCIILDGVASRGEYHRFNPQNEFIFWREIWLERV